MINRKAACCQRLLVQQSQHRDSAMVLDIKSVVRSTTCEHVKQKYVVASPLKRILWNKGSDSGLTGFVFENICAKVVLYDF